ncbi:hypothetical protein BaRGS_00015429, partial [Batillaria attramentaria]
MPCNTKFIEGEDFGPISAAFTLVFGVCMLVQFVGMVIHRLNTLLHIAADRDIKRPSRGRTANQ